MHTRKSEDNKIWNNHIWCIFPPTSVSSSFESQCATGLSITDNCCTCCSTYSYFQVFWCYKDMTKRGYCCSLTGMFGFQSHSCWTGIFYYHHTCNSQKPRSNCCRNRILFSHSYQDWGTHTWQEQHVNAVNFRKPRVYYYHMYLPKPEFTYRLINPLPFIYYSCFKTLKN